jgi:transcriptional antiterminator RfaH
VIEPAMLNSTAWYVVHTKPKQEFRALEQLENQGYHCFLPTLRVERAGRITRKTCLEPLFARYLMIHLNSTTENWSPIRSTRGVNGLLKFGDRFATLQDQYVETLKSVPQEALRRLFMPGDHVSVCSGPFAGIDGIYQADDGEARALVLIEMMSHPQKLSFAVEMLHKTR